METVVITVGKEVLSGKTVNTNLRDIAMMLSQIGVEIKKSFVIDDDIEEYHKILDIVNEDLIIFTGGLGPTVDDLTREAVYQYYGVETYIDQGVLDTIQAYFTRRSLPMGNANHKQAIFPKNSIILKNRLGTAPGVYFTVDDQHIVLLPGPPRELRPMLEEVIDYFRHKLDFTMFSEGFKLVGTGESAMEEQLLGFYEQHPNVNIAPYAGLGEIKYIFTSKNNADLQKAKEAFHKQFSHYIYGDLNDSLAGVIVSLLQKNNAILSTVESCTGGLVASSITSVSGASSVFHEGFITYSNEAKMKYLDVEQKILDTFGAVSEECVYQMAKHLLDKTTSDYALSISGIAGPNGGTEEKPVGLVYFGLAYKDQVDIKRVIFNGNRTMIQNRAKIYALNMLRKVLLNA